MHIWESNCVLGRSDETTALDLLTPPFKSLRIQGTSIWLLFLFIAWHFMNCACLLSGAKSDEINKSQISGSSTWSCSHQAWLSPTVKESAHQLIFSSLITLHLVGLIYCIKTTLHSCFSCQAVFVRSCQATRRLLKVSSKQWITVFHKTPPLSQVHYLPNIHLKQDWEICPWFSNCLFFLFKSSSF